MYIQEIIDHLEELLGYVEIDSADVYVVALNEGIEILRNVKKLAEGEMARKELLCTVGSSEEKTT